MLDHETTLDYLASSAGYGGRGDVPFGANTPCWDLPFAVMRSGALSVQTTREVGDAYRAAHPDAGLRSGRIPVAVGLRWVASDDGGKVPLLLVPGLLDMSGALLPNPHERAWIPQRLCSSEGTVADVPSVCEQDALRAHQSLMDGLPDDGRWSTAVSRATSLFDAVLRSGGDATFDGRPIQSDPAILRIWEGPDASCAASEVLRHVLAATGEGHDEAMSGPLRTLVNRDAPAQDEQEDVLPNDEFLDSKLLCAVPDRLEPLGPDDRAALSALARQKAGDVLAIHAPKGTNARTVALCAMANRLAECALRGDDAPLMMAVGSRETSLLLTGALADRPPLAQSSVFSRWLPRIAREGEERRVLGPLPSVALWHGCASDDDKAISACLADQTPDPAEGDAGRYADPWYVPQATTSFLDRATTFLHGRVRDVGEAAALLSERLRRIDQDRCELIDAYARVCAGAELLRERDAQLEEIGRLRGEHRACRERLGHWRQVSARNPFRRPLVGWSDEDQSEIVAAHAVPGEDLATGRAYVEDVCAAYREQIAHIESSIDRLRGTSVALSRKAKGAQQAGEQCIETIRRLGTACGLTPDDTHWLETTIDGRDVSMGRLDEVLDQTVRPAEFWLAVHVYEARWLAICQRPDTLRRTIRAEGKDAWAAEANLAPLGVAPWEDLLAQATRRGMTGEDGRRLDLAVVLDADAVTAPQGAALLALADHAVVMGSATSLGPIQTHGVLGDRLYVAGDDKEQTWRDLQSWGLSASGGSSLFAALSQRECACETRCLRDDATSYGELVDLRQDLVPEEQVNPVRVPANGSDDPDYALDDLVVPVSYVLVPDSSWRQVEGSKENQAEAMATVRWLERHVADVIDRYPGDAGSPVLVTSPYRAQARLLGQLVRQSRRIPTGSVDVQALRDVGSRRWRLVVMDATCGPQAQSDDCAKQVRGILGTMASAATDATVLFCGGVWMKSDDAAALSYLRRASRVGRLFSIAREGLVTLNKDKARPKLEPLIHHAGSQPLVEVDLRVKPLALTTLLERLHERGQLAHVPPVPEMNLTLEQVGLIERHTDDAGRRGWRPTAAGREIGIVSTTDREGHPFCAYSASASPVILSIALSATGD